MPEAGHGAYDKVFLESVGLISRARQKGSDRESKDGSLPLLSLAFCFFRLYALPFGMVRVAGFRTPQVERCAEWYVFCAFLLCLLIGTNDFFMRHLDSVPVFP